MPKSPHLIAVVLACHGVAVNAKAADEQAAWVGIYPDEAPLLYDHIKYSVSLAALLGAYWIPTGGATRLGTRLSEAESAANVAEAAGWTVDKVEPPHAKKKIPKARVIIECHARDSLWNLALANAEIHRKTGSYAEELIVIGYKFKRDRFLHHFKTLQFTSKFHYLGINDPHPDILPGSLIGEFNKYRDVQADPLLLAQVWRDQRQARDPYNERYPDYSAVDSKLAKFLDYMNGGEYADPPSW